MCSKGDDNIMMLSRQLVMAMHWAHWEQASPCCCIQLNTSECPKCSLITKSSGKHWNKMDARCLGEKERKRTRERKKKVVLVGEPGHLQSKSSPPQFRRASWSQWNALELLPHCPSWVMTMAQRVISVLEGSASAWRSAAVCWGSTALCPWWYVFFFKGWDCSSDLALAWSLSACHLLPICSTIPWQQNSVWISYESSTLWQEQIRCPWEPKRLS